jgi:hypothetical protein
MQKLDGYSPTTGASSHRAKHRWLLTSPRCSRTRDRNRPPGHHPTFCTLSAVHSSSLWFARIPTKVTSRVLLRESWLRHNSGKLDTHDTWRKDCRKGEEDATRPMHICSPNER